MPWSTDLLNQCPRIMRFELKNECRRALSWCAEWEYRDPALNQKRSASLFALLKMETIFKGLESRKR